MAAVDSQKQRSEKLALYTSHQVEIWQHILGRLTAYKNVKKWTIEILNIKVKFFGIGSRKKWEVGLKLEYSTGQPGICRLKFLRHETVTLAQLGPTEMKACVKYHFKFDS